MSNECPSCLLTRPAGEAIGLRSKVGFLLRSIFQLGFYLLSNWLICYQNGLALDRPEHLCTIVRMPNTVSFVFQMAPCAHARNKLRGSKSVNIKS